MRLFNLIRTATLLLSFGVCSLTVHAASDDPGAGRLSGNSIPAEFYYEDSSNSMTNQEPLRQYGSSQKKSPYTGIKYTHLSRFDNRKILHGIDVSRWQGKINWNAVKADGIDYAFIQVGFRGYGDSGVLGEATLDPYFHTNMKNAIAAGIRVGVYVFSQATTEAEAIEEADYILDEIADYNITMPLVMDFEYASTDYGLGGRLYKANLSKSKATKVCMAFCQEIAAAGFTPMVYANKSMLEDQLNADTLTEAGYRLWLANYTDKTAYSGSFDFWQYSEKGKVNGIKGDVDMNFYYAQDTDSFVLPATSIFHADFTDVADQIYTGNSFTPNVIVTHNGITLTPNVDYTISHSNNKKVGTATITITGLGAYTHVKKIHYKILLQSVTSLRNEKRTKNSITLSWDKASGVKGYEIYRSSAINGEYKKIKTISKKATTSYKDSKLTTGQCYYYKIRTYRKDNGVLYYGDFSPITSIYTKAAYTRNAVTKNDTVLYDYIPGSKATVYANAELQAYSSPLLALGVVSGNTSGNGSIDVSGDASGNGSIDVSGDASGNDSTDVSGDASGNGSIDVSGDASGNGSTDVSSDASDNGSNGSSSTENAPFVPETSTETTPDGTTTTVPIESLAIAEIPKGTSLSVIYSTKNHKNKKWYYVSYEANGITYKGFIAAKKVNITKIGKVVKTKKVNVRKKTSAYSKKLTTLKKNKKVTVLDTKKVLGVTWYQVHFKKNGKTYKGWISAPYINLI